MNNVDKQYLENMKYILDNGERVQNRTGIDTLSVFGLTSRIDLKDGLPMLTTKKMHAKSFIWELLWFLQGRTDVKFLQDNNVRIWNEWANSEGELVSCYGKQWRRWEGIDYDSIVEIDAEKKYRIKKTDQIAYIINEIKTNPYSRRLVLNAWNPNEIDIASLCWCHSQVIFKVSNFGGNEKPKLNCSLTQRSCDWFLGCPANWLSYAILTHMIAQVCDLDVGSFVHHAVDAHLYVNHLDAAKEQLIREPYKLPKLWLNPDIKNIDDFKYSDIRINDYISHSTIKAEVAI